MIRKLVRNCRCRYQYRYKFPVIFFACCPKSGSTWFANVLARVIPCYRYFHPEAIRQLDGGTADITEEVLREFRGRYAVARAHTPATPANLRAMDQAFGRWVFLTRDLRDVTVSIYHHLHRYPKSSFLNVGANRRYPWTPLPREVLRLPKQECLDVIITRLLPDMVTLVQDWAEASETRPTILGLRYEDITQDTEEAIQRVVRFFGIQVRPSRVRRVIARYDRSKLQGGKWKFRSGEIGGWRTQLSKGQQQEIERMCEDLPDGFRQAA